MTKDHTKLTRALGDIIYVRTILHPDSEPHKVLEQALADLREVLAGEAVEPGAPLCVTCGTHHRSPWEPCPQCGEIHHPDNTCGPARKARGSDPLAVTYHKPDCASLSVKVGQKCPPCSCGAQLPAKSGGSR